MDTTVDRPRTPLVGLPGATLTENVRRTLLDIIIRGEFAHGDRLYPERLSERFGVSVTPVREALMQLASEGFIEGVQRRGFHVRTPSPLHMTELWQVRRALEVTAGELCIARLQKGEVTDADLQQLADLQTAQQDSRILASHVDKLELNTRFHNRIVELSGNSVLIGLYEGIQVKVAASLAQRGLDTWRERVKDEAAEHWAIIESLRQRDLNAYSTAVTNHIARSLRDALVDLDAQGVADGPALPG